MIVRVLPMGKDAAGLTRYLFGPGKANEHTNQRMVAGSPELHAEWGSAALTSREATVLGRIVESSWRRQYATELAVAGQGVGGVSRANLAGGEGAVAGQSHVFHAAISLHHEEGTLTDDQWALVAQRYVEGMGFVGSADRPGPHDVSWFAVNHGLSDSGNDHLHIVVCATRRNGSTIDTNNTGRRSQEVRRNVLEHLDFVTPLHDRNETGQTLKSYTAAEHNIARERAAQGKGSATPDRVQLQRIVRAAATQATNEAEFINHVLAHPGVQMTAVRWLPGTDGRVVSGYTVALNGGVAIPSSKLASDLTLQKLRQRWSESPESASVARALWQGDASKLDELRATLDVPEQLEHAATQLRQFNDQIAGLDPRDKDGWQEAQGSLAGTVTMLATGRPVGLHPTTGRSTGFGPDAGRAADTLARQALADTWNRPPSSAPQVATGPNGAEVATRHIQLALRAGHTDQHRGWLAVVQQLNRAVDAIRSAQEARGELLAARALTRDVATSLDRLEDYLTGREGELSAKALPETHSRPERTSERLLREQNERGHHSQSAETLSESGHDALRTSVRAPEAKPTLVTPSTPQSPTTPSVPSREPGENDKGRGKGRPR